MFNSQERSSILLQSGESFYLPPGCSLHPFADDNGYAYHKVAMWVIDLKGEHVIRTACIPSRAQIGRVNVCATGAITGLYTIDHTDYTVGAAVPEPESIRNASYAYSELNNVLLVNALIASGLGGLPVRLSTGLPLKQYFKNDGSVDHELIQRIKLSLKPLAKPFNVDDENGAIVDQHIIVAESLAAFVDWYLNDKGEAIQNVVNGVLVVDVGGGTTDISFINSENQIVMPNSDTRRIGILDLFKKLRSLLSDMHSIDQEHIREDMLDTAIRTCQFIVRGRSVDCGNEVAAAKKFVAKRLNNYVNDFVSDTLDHIIFVGGGAEVLRAELLSIEEYADGFVLIPDNPQFSNVRGMLKFMTFVSQQEADDLAPERPSEE